MEKLKVFDFDYGCGGFSKGLEDSGLFEVIYNGSINSNNKYCYNNTHINFFQETDVIPSDCDLVVYTPHIGNKLYGIGSGNIDFSQLNNFLVLCMLKNFDNVIFITQREAIPLLQIFNKVLINSNGFPTKDIISCRLLDMGYNVYNFVLDGAGFGLCQHKYYNVYWASKCVDESILIKEGFGFHKRPYRQVQHVIGDIRDDSNLSWHKPDYKMREFCSFVSPGSSASKTKELSQTSGYIRLDANNIISPSLSYDFYKISSKGPSINPWYDRPLTIREGARLFGLTDDFDWDIRLHRKDVAMMIYEAFPPVISKLMANKISKLIKNE